MSQEQLAQLFAPISSSLRELGVSSLSVFGSFARGEPTESCDLDVLVEFDGPTTSDKYFGVLFLLEDTFHRRVDLAEPDTLHPLIRDRVISEAVRVA